MNMSDDSGKREVECQNCGHRFMTKAKRPQCSKCKSYSLKEVIGEEINESSSDDFDESSESSTDELMNQHDELMNHQVMNDESSTEKSSTEIQEDLTKDIKGESILETKPKKPKKKKEKQEKKEKKEKKEGKKEGSGLSWLFLIGALFTGYMIYRFLRKSEKEEIQEREETGYGFGLA